MGKAKVKSLKDLLMLLLYAKGHKGMPFEPIQGRTRLMKMVFLFKKEIIRKFNFGKVIPDEVMPDFTPYDFGPFSTDVYDDLKFLIGLEFISLRPARSNERFKGDEALEYMQELEEVGPAGPTGPTGLTGSDYNENYAEEFTLTVLGQGFVQEELGGSLNQAQWDALEEFKSRCTGTSLKALLYYVYKNYPEMAKESQIRDEIL
jgi:hypothetical protein